MAELVASSIRQRIVRGELQEGDSLPPESDLMARYEVSRPTLREAFRVLEAESLITIRRGSRGGAQVHALTTKAASRQAALLLQVRGATYGDLHGVRLLLEATAARQLADRGRAVIRQLAATAAEEEAALGDADAFAAAARRFHRGLVDSAGSTSLALFCEMAADVLALRPDAATECEPAAEHDVHLRLLDRARAGDADGAEQVWRDHLEAMGPGRSLATAKVEVPLP